MILRRIIQHVHDQNWTAIAIDFAVGGSLLIGLQVPNGTDARRHAHDESEQRTSESGSARQ